MVTKFELMSLCLCAGNVYILVIIPNAVWGQYRAQFPEQHMKYPIVETRHEQHI